jgi:hypothetical protein
VARLYFKERERKAQGARRKAGTQGARRKDQEQRRKARTKQNTGAII